MASGTPDFFNRTIITADNVEQGTADVTDSDTTVTFTQLVKAFVVYNDGNNAVHINYDATAATSNFKIPPRGFKMLAFPVTVLHFICATGETATVFAEGLF